jgi:hypothetical protein
LLDLVREEKDFWKGSAFVISLFIPFESMVPLVLWCLTRLSYTWPTTICSPEEN